MAAYGKSTAKTLPDEGGHSVPDRTVAHAAREPAGRAIKLFRGLSDYSRLSILQALRAGPLTVREIVAATGLSQPNASNHLRCLSDCCLVASEQRGRFVQCRLSGPSIDRLLAMADEVLAGAEQGLNDCGNYRG